MNGRDAAWALALTLLVIGFGSGALTDGDFLAGVLFGGAAVGGVFWLVLTDHRRSERRDGR